MLGGGQVPVCTLCVCMCAVCVHMCDIKNHYKTVTYCAELAHVTLKADIQHGKLSPLQIGSPCPSLKARKILLLDS